MTLILGGNHTQDIHVRISETFKTALEMCFTMFHHIDQELFQSKLHVDIPVGYTVYTNRNEDGDGPAPYGFMMAV